MQIATAMKANPTLNELIEKTAEGFFDYVRPSILMIGEWDDYFSIIKSQYKWAKHRVSIPGRIDRETSLIITNYRHYYLHLVPLIKTMKLNTAILAYDETNPIPPEERSHNDNLVCYLSTLSPRYINGHIRSMLQLKRWYLGTRDDNPLVISDPGSLNTIRHSIQALDAGLPINIVTNDPYYYFLVFKVLADNSHYSAVKYIEHPNQFDDHVSHDYTTLILNINSEQEFKEYQKKPLMEFTTIFISSKEIKSKNTNASFCFNELGNSKNDCMLLAYYYSLQVNLLDASNRTRFIQSGDITSIYEQSNSYFEFYKRLQTTYDDKKIKFRNIAPTIRNVSYGNNPLNFLIDELVERIYKEFFEQTNNALEHAEMVSGISRSTLQPILAKIQDNTI